MKMFKKRGRKFKRYWRLFLKSHILLDTTTYRFVYYFKQPMREIDILNFLLDFILFIFIILWPHLIQTVLLKEINNKIKVIKWMAFGYRSFYHFKSRILMIQNLTQPNRKNLVAKLLGFHLKSFIVIDHNLINNTIW